MRKGKRKIAVFDTETDPWKYGRIPKPFSVGYYDGSFYKEWWGQNCVKDFIKFMAQEPKTILYAHNGGKFDFHFLLQERAIGNPLLINNGRIVKAGFMQHEIRDSYAAIPVPLAAWRKDEIDYRKMEANVREYHRGEILAYLKEDCLSLYELITGFITRFGLKLTMAKAAMEQLKEFHSFDTITKTRDDLVRKFYIGARVQPFINGIHKGDWKIYDTNSMYPFVMSEYQHPIGSGYFRKPADKRTLYRLLEKDKTFFTAIRAKSKGAFPFKTKEGLFFPNETLTYRVTSHELKTALKYGLADVKNVETIVMCDKTTSFATFVDYFMKQKIASHKSGDKGTELHSKLILNSCYGKFAQNPANFYEWDIQFYGKEYEKPDEDEGWELHECTQYYETWKRKEPKLVYHNVGTSASITGAARAVLLEGIVKGDRVAYCDTDSLICEHLDMPLHAYHLGAWKREGYGDLLGIGGKKLYALFRDGECIKKASKGVKFSGDQIMRVCADETLQWKSEIPTYSFLGPVKFVVRRVAKTVH